MKNIFKAFILFFILCVSNIESTPNNKSFLWQGFKHRLQREILSFLNSHRMGSIGNRIKSYNFNDELKTANAEIELKFTPGVNGDWAYPTSKFSIIQTQNDSMAFDSQRISFNFTDEADHGSSPSANSTVYQNFTILNEYEIAIPILNGFSVQMKCIHESCNSNGVWPSKFYIDISKCDKLNCQLEFVLNRGWTPTHGGGKAFNYKMSYYVEIEVITAYTNKKESTLVIDDDITHTSDIYSGPVELNREFYLNRTESSEAFTGIKAFGFELQKYHFVKNTGRYLQEIRFEIGNTKYVPGKLSYNAILNVNSCKTVLPSDIIYFMKTSSFIIQNTFIKDNLSVTTTVCKNDSSTFFNCKKLGYEDKQVDIIKYSSKFDS